jgi:hypothetical protein
MLFVCVCVCISIYEPLDGVTKFDVNAVPLQNIPLLISYISNNNMVVAQACEVEETRVTLTARKQTTVARATFLYNIKKKMATVRTFYVVSGSTAIIARNAKFGKELHHKHIYKI